MIQKLTKPATYHHAAWFVLPTEKRIVLSQGQPCPFTVYSLGLSLLPLCSVFFIKCNAVKSAALNFCIATVELIMVCSQAQLPTSMYRKLVFPVPACKLKSSLNCH